jgi:hypothetical protein
MSFEPFLYVKLSWFWIPAHNNSSALYVASKIAEKVVLTNPLDFRSKRGTRSLHDATVHLRSPRTSCSKHIRRQPPRKSNVRLDSGRDLRKYFPGRCFGPEGSLQARTTRSLWSAIALISRRFSNLVYASLYSKITISVLEKKYTCLNRTLSERPELALFVWEARLQGHPASIKESFHSAENLLKLLPALRALELDPEFSIDR